MLCSPPPLKLQGELGAQRCAWRPTPSGAGCSNSSGCSSMQRCEAQCDMCSPAHHLPPPPFSHSPTRESNRPRHTLACSMPVWHCTHERCGWGSRSCCRRHPQLRAENTGKNGQPAPQRMQLACKQQECFGESAVHDLNAREATPTLNAHKQCAVNAHCAGCLRWASSSARLATLQQAPAHPLPARPCTIIVG